MVQGKIGQFYTFKGNKKLISDAFWNIFASVLPLFAVVVSIGLFYRNLEPSVSENLLFLYVVVSAFTISDFGVGRISCTKLIEARLKGEDTICLIINSLLASFIVGSFVFILVVCVLCVFLDFTIYISLLLAGAVFFTVIFNGIRAIAEGFENFKALFKHKTIQTASIYIIPGIFSFYNSELVYYVFIIFALRVSTVTWILCEQILPRIRSKPVVGEFWSIDLRDYYNYGKWSVFSNIISIILSYIDRILVSRLLITTESLSYLSAVDVTNRSSIISNGILQASYSRLVSRTGHTPKNVFLVVFTVFLMAAIVFALVGESILRIWLGSYQPFMLEVIILLIFATSFNAMAQVCYYSLLSKFNQRTIANIHLFELIFYAPVAYLLIRNIGVMGGALSLLFRNIFDFFLLRLMEIRYS